LQVDTTRGSTIRINLNMSFPALPCSTITLDTLDISGERSGMGGRRGMHSGLGV
jgi:hypothetical protein